MSISTKSTSTSTLTSAYQHLNEAERDLRNFIDSEKESHRLAAAFCQAIIDDLAAKRAMLGTAIAAIDAMKVEVKPWNR